MTRIWTILMRAALVALAVPACQALPVQWGYTGNAYEAVHVPEGISWSAAQEEAMKRGGHLATIGSAQENEFVYLLAMQQPELWFYNQYHCGIGPWLGGQQQEDCLVPSAKWSWVTGEDFSYTCWAEDEPNDFAAVKRGRNEESALTFIGQHGSLTGRGWNDYPPEDRPSTGQPAPRGYIIEWNMFVLNPDGTCPPGQPNPVDGFCPRLLAVGRFEHSQG